MFSKSSLYLFSPSCDFWRLLSPYLFVMFSQVMRIVDNVRPDRQTVMFSATFPRAMEALARRILSKPIEVQVGGRSVVCSDVEQQVVGTILRKPPVPCMFRQCVILWDHCDVGRYFLKLICINCSC